MDETESSKTHAIAEAGLSLRILGSGIRVKSCACRSYQDFKLLQLHMQLSHPLIHVTGNRTAVMRP